MPLFIATPILLLWLQYNKMTSSSRRENSRFPWYKERLQWKYLANQQRQLNTLISHKWRFLVPSEAEPLCPDNHELSEKPPLVLPLIHPRSNYKSVTKSSPFRVKNQHLSDVDICSKLTPLQQARQRRINSIERSLTIKHHTTDNDTQTDNAEENKDIDDCVESENEEEKDDKESNSSDAEQVYQTEEDIIIPIPKEVQLADQAAIYHWPLLKSAQEIAKEELEMAKRRAVSPTQEAQVNRVTNELIEWSKNLGDDSKEYIDEHTIKRLFASDYEAKPVLTAPIHIVELKNIPHELRAESRGYTGSSYRALSAVERLKLLESSSGPSTAVRYKYGAWYLKPSLWKLRPSSEPLEDPKVVKKRQEMEIRMKKESLDAVLMETHGAQAFQNFIANKYKEPPSELAANVNGPKIKINVISC